LLVLAGPWLVAPGLNAADLQIRNATLIDGTGAPPREGVSIVLRDGRIAEIGREAEAPGVPLLDVGGATVLPGLIDSHVHLAIGPGVALRDAKRETWGALRPHYLRAYLACGVTTVLDAGAPAIVVRRIQSWLSAGNPGPRYLALGPFVKPPGGYPPEISGPVSSVEEVEAKLDEIQSLGTVGVKVPIERGRWPFGKLPIHAPEIREAIERGAAKRHLPIYVHATSEKDQAIALDMGAHALMHPILYRDERLSDSFLARMARAGTYQVSTLSIMDAPLAMFHSERLADALLELVVPKIELEAARNPEAARAALRQQLGRNAPWLPEMFWGPVAWFYFSERAQVAEVRRAQRSLRRLHEAGVPIVVGSDSPYDPWAVYPFHGPTTLREIELVGEAGLSPMEALEAATRVSAEMLGLADEIGTVEVGKRADLVVVRGDPLRDLRALRNVQWTVRDGVARTPEQWMAR
jgi:imidazolonepropionase-like amidohydrolase